MGQRRGHLRHLDSGEKTDRQGLTEITSANQEEVGLEEEHVRMRMRRMGPRMRAHTGSKMIGPRRSARWAQWRVHARPRRTGPRTSMHAAKEVGPKQEHMCARMTTRRTAPRRSGRMGPRRSARAFLVQETIFANWELALLTRTKWWV